jgi:hypothetical protein
MTMPAADRDQLNFREQLARIDRELIHAQQLTADAERKRQEIKLAPISVWAAVIGASFLGGAALVTAVVAILRLAWRLP